MPEPDPYNPPPPSGKDSEIPGELTDAARRALRREPGGFEELQFQAAAKLRQYAHMFLDGRDHLDLTNDELQLLTLESFEGTPDFDLRSRIDFFNFARRRMHEIVTQVARRQGQRKDSIEGVREHPLFGRAHKTEPAREVARVILDIGNEAPEFAEVLNFSYVLRFSSREIAQTLDEPEPTTKRKLRRANALLKSELKRRNTQSEHQGDLDRPGVEEYPADDSLSLHRLPDESGPSTADLETLRAENTDLRSELDTAKERIAELEARAPLDPSTTAETRASIETTVWSPLADVPLYEGITDVEQVFAHLKTNYGHLLAHFGADRDYTSRPAINQHDPNFITKAEQAISIQRREEKQEFGAPRTPTLGMIMPKESDVGDRELAAVTIEGLFESHNRELAVLTYGRLRRYLYGK